MAVVADSSPLCYLRLIEATSILPHLYGEVFIPPAVLIELRHSKAPRPVQEFASTPPEWLVIEEPRSLRTIRRLHAGEGAAISLAIQKNVPLIIDEKTGREVASGPPWNLKIIGTLGVLEQAACRNLIELGDALARLCSTRFHVHRQLVEEALKRDVERKRLP